MGRIGLPFYWVDELAEITFRNGVVRDSVCRWPSSLRQVKCSEEIIENREMHGEVFVDGLALRAVVPVMELGKGGLCDLSSRLAAAKYSGS
jgi:hypothetical protein